MSNEGLIALKVINGHGMTADERASLSPPTLAQLAIGKHVALTRAERDRMEDGLLASLVIGGNAVLDRGEIERFDTGLRFVVETAFRR